MFNSGPSTPTPAWRLQDAKAQFSALVDKALLGVPQHVTRSGKPAVVVLSEQDFKTLQQSAASRSAAAPTSFIDHLLAIPKTAEDEQNDLPRLDASPREVDFS